MDLVNTSSTTNPIYMYNNLNNFILNPIVFIIIFFIILFYFIFSFNKENGTSSLGIENNNNSNNISNIIIFIILAIFFILIIINVFQYFFSINVIATIKDIFTNKPVLDITVDQNSNQINSYPTPSPVPQLKFKKQVFNIPGNYYNYENSKAICKAYGAELANYNQIENAYNNGAEWCNYGWSADQLALFPTQKETYNKLQKIPGHENDCGRPGINGGFISNKNVKFGVNCFGYKPKISSEEESLMKTLTPYPETKQDIDFQNQVDYWKNKVDEILVSPFNYNTWASY